eukprot:RCo040770
MLSPSAARLVLLLVAVAIPVGFWTVSHSRGIQSSSRQLFLQLSSVGGNVSRSIISAGVAGVVSPSPNSTQPLIGSPAQVKPTAVIVPLRAVVHEEGPTEHHCVNNHRLKSGELSCQFRNLCVNGKGQFVYFYDPGPPLAPFELLGKSKGLSRAPAAGWFVDTCGIRFKGHLDERRCQFRLKYLYPTTEQRRFNITRLPGIFMLHHRILMGNPGHTVMQNLYPVLYLFWAFHEFSRIPDASVVFLGKCTDKEAWYTASPARCEHMSLFYSIAFPRATLELSQLLKEHAPTSDSLLCFEEALLGHSRFDLLPG